MLVQLDESELIKQLSRGDRKAFTVLYKRDINNLYRYIYFICNSKELTEEIAQCIFIKIWERRETLGNITSFRSYLYRSAKNLLLDHIKRSKTEAKILVMVQPVSEESCERSDDYINYKDYYLIAQDAINLLPEKRRQIVELRTKDGLSLDEIATKLSISKATVKKQLYTGMDFVRKYIHSHSELTIGLFLIGIWSRLFSS
ncbi:sigma-70 family RNA polymerase sigma factor [Mucilaginibacter rubeus]|uniref:Sigma-70 family RNA polymerase sigma factor n=1 Tax=Mucilaginibacter rubeus TaxID=2027860 RepID=A0AAE6MLH2_9SPHI|nr:MULTISPECIES: sigma-70 family RNA polymerase sigma factor [Mucilaginibacter]QEM07177.1 sigma-70 family RNA polymerase sigma factor [Mucilaginibacter rubeus]QEM19633.1 sigma-70 family RNA polymerase sigma factor [Mucilaginibacter gossypii]QTE43674.1 sigma-70 family RNA polymerase sigma factor [Mucilaginibacter rubeus]QTE50274.1 sigma-70 family RNA polymerase sigma factor [Mucilaginibacter rubeus]QTE55361.1 sigma-70 family RNA polymerase sigma factor [Mucilaginibacter rubeus]